MLRKRLGLTLISICASGLAAAVTLGWNAQLAELINTVSGGQVLPLQSIVWALLTILLAGVVDYAKAMISSFTCESMAHDLRMGYARYFASLSVAESEALNAGEQLSRLQNEIADVSAYLNANLFQLADDNLRFLFTLVWLLILNPRLTLSANLPLTLILLYVLWASKTIRSATERSQQAKSKMNAYADTLLTLFPIIRLYDASKLIVEGYQDSLRAWEVENVRSERIRARLLSLSALLSSIPLLLLFWVGGGLVLQGNMTLGALYLFLNLSGNVSGVMMNMPGFVAAFRQFTVNLERLSPRMNI